MSITATFNQNLRAALEQDRGSAPSGGLNGRPWYEGGRWHTIITDGLPSIQNAQATIFPQGHAGDRRINQQAPVVGRQWSEGDLSAPVVADFLGLLLYAAFGSLSTNMTPTTSAPTLLLNAEPLSSPKSLVLNNQPSDGGALLRFTIDGIQGPGTISVCGIDAYGNGASELITTGSAGVFWSRTSWSSIAASGIAISGLSAGTVSLSGIRNYTHTFTNASVAPTIAFERQGVPTTGEGSATTNNAFIHPAMVLRSLTLEANAEQEDGLFMVSADFEGDPSGASTKSTLQGPSSLKIWPAWTLQVKRDNGTSWDVVQSINLTINTGNRNYRAAAGVQGPQGSFFGGVEATGSIEILVNNELEYNKWRQASEIQMHALWNSPWKLAGSTHYQLSLSMPAYLDNIQEQESDNAWILSGDFRIVRNDNFPFSGALRNGVPGRGYLGSGT